MAVSLAVSHSSAVRIAQKPNLLQCLTDSNWWVRIYYPGWRFQKSWISRHVTSCDTSCRWASRFCENIENIQTDIIKIGLENFKKNETRDVCNQYVGQRRCSPRCPDMRRYRIWCKSLDSTISPPSVGKASISWAVGRKKRIQEQELVKCDRACVRSSIGKFLLVYHASEVEHSSCTYQKVMMT